MLEDEQAYLAVSSAARIFQKEVEGKKIILTKVGETTTTSISGVAEAAHSEPINSALISIAGGTEPAKITVTSPENMKYLVDISFKVKTEDKSFDVYFKAYDDNPNKPLYETTMHFNSYLGEATIYNVDGSPAKKLTKVRWSVYGEDTKRGEQNNEP
jgi:hypothetical protein